MPADAPSPPIAMRLLGQGEGWSVSEVVCRAGPADPSFEERHDGFTIAAVLAGRFGYHSAPGRALLHPGAFLLGNHGACYECGHEHGAGDRCVSLRLSPELFEEIAGFTAGTAGFRFSSPIMPALPTLAADIVTAEALAGAREPEAVEETALALAGHVVATSAGRSLACEPCPPADERRVARALAAIEERSGAPLTLTALARIAAMSRFHFLRRFRRVTGQTPYRYLLGVRLRRAALRLRRSEAPVSTIAYDSGFGDLSTFNARFRATFGMAPGAYRRATA